MQYLRNCGFCKKEFTASQPGQRYCNLECRKLFYRMKIGRQNDHFLKMKLHEIRKKRASKDAVS